MKSSFAILILNIPTMLSIIASFFLLNNGVKGWGLFLFVALVLGHTLSKNESVD